VTRRAPDSNHASIAARSASRPTNGTARGNAVVARVTRTTLPQGEARESLLRYDGGGMHVRLDRYETANRSVQTRSLLAFVFGGIGLVFFGFLTFLGILMTAMPEGEGGGLWERRAGIFLGLFVGFVPMVLSALAVAWGVRQRARFRRLGELVALARHTPHASTAELAHALRLTPVQADGLVLEATTLGLVDARALGAAAPPILTASAARAANAATVPAASVGAAPPGAAAQPRAVTFGTVLGSYRIEEPLGRGGMGAVHAARHVRTGRRYAVKTMHPGPSASEGAIRRFEREATAASALGHPGIVQVHDFDQAPGGLFYLVMDLLEGETLQGRLARSGPLPWRAARRLALELCDALAAAHEHGLIHRDIKPSNIVLARRSRASGTEDEDRAVLVDFGLVKPLAESGSAVTSTGAVLGTPMYMSPEQARGEELDVRSDLYSVAAVVFEAVTGAPPFHDRTLASVYARILGEPAPKASHVARRPVPPGLDDVLGRALAKDRTARHASARELAAAFAALGGADDEARAPATQRLGG